MTGALMKSADVINQAKELHEQGQLDAATQFYKAVLAQEPAHAEALMLQGLIAFQKKDYLAAETLFKQSIEANPKHPPTWCNYGSLLQQMDRLDEAIGSFKNAIRLDPEFAIAYQNLGNAYAARGALDKAIGAYGKALELNRDLLDARINAAIAYRELGKYETAETSFLKILRVLPDCAEAAHNLGSLYAEWGKLKEAKEYLEKAIALKPDYAEAYSNLGALYLEMGQQDKAMEYFEQAPNFSPQYHIAESNKIFAMHYDPDISSQQLFDAAIAWGNKYAPISLANPPALPKDREKILRIGYVSADFRAHPIGIFMESVLAAHTGQVEIFCYANMPHEDHQTHRIRPSVKHWRRIFGKSDAEVERIIRDDKIDILIDLSGHTAANRLKVFAAKPAPVQMTWIGYFDTLGMEAMDYIICDEHVLPKQSEKWFVEKPLRMPETYLCFTPPPYDDITPAVAPLKKNGYVTFGCFNRLNKMTPDVLSCWAQILKQVPGSHLFLKTKAFADEPICESMRDMFKEHGIAADRLRFEGGELRRLYMAKYNEVDIVLDPFPYGGGTTTAEALWMGRPVITWPQERFIGRLSSSLLHAVHKAEWIAGDRADYIAKAVKLAKDTERMEATHETLRTEFLSSAACDAKAFVTHLEALYRKAWRKYCEK